MPTRPAIGTRTMPPAFSRVDPPIPERVSSRRCGSMAVSGNPPALVVTADGDEGGDVVGGEVDGGDVLVVVVGAVVEVVEVVEVAGLDDVVVLGVVVVAVDVVVLLVVVVVGADVVVVVVEVVVLGAGRSAMVMVYAPSEP